MKIRDSGMPDELQWESFFDVDRCLELLDFSASADVVDFGCGYGSFTVAAAKRTRGTVFAIDLEPAMITATAQKAKSLGLNNVQTVLRDFVAVGTGLPDASVEYAMQFNILHAERPLTLLQEAYRVLKSSGKIALMHWVHDASTPRGPDLRIRPRPEQLRQWLTECGFEVTKPFVALPPYHFGAVGTR
jgi:ubiquinone/menaquinone biosynthesis C-methylase UbiE